MLRVPGPSDRSPLNFVWVGPPKIKDGGHDVSAINSIHANYVKFNAPASDRNPIVFWCQKEYCDQYKEYFNSKNIPVVVNAIEDYLSSTESKNDDEINQKVLAVFKQIIEDKEKRNRIVDRVCFKDLFFLLLSANEGGYVLDTNMQARQDSPLNFPEYEKHHYPVVQNMGNSTDVVGVDVWMMYFPRTAQAKARARQSLDLYLEKYQGVRDLFTTEGYTEKYHRSACGIAAHSLTLDEEAAYRPHAWMCSKLKKRRTLLFLIPVLMRG